MAQRGLTAEESCRQALKTIAKVDPASGGDDETDIIIAGRQVPFVQVGMIVIGLARGGSQRGRMSSCKATNAKGGE